MSNPVLVVLVHCTLLRKHLHCFRTYFVSDFSRNLTSEFIFTWKCTFAVDFLPPVRGIKILEESPLIFSLCSLPVSRTVSCVLKGLYKRFQWLIIWEKCFWEKEAASDTCDCSRCLPFLPRDKSGWWQFQVHYRALASGLIYHLSNWGIIPNQLKPITAWHWGIILPCLSAEFAKY